MRNTKFRKVITSGEGTVEKTEGFPSTGNTLFLSLGVGVVVYTNLFSSLECAICFIKKLFFFKKKKYTKLLYLPEEIRLLVIFIFYVIML